MHFLKNVYLICKISVHIRIQHPKVDKKVIFLFLNIFITQNLLNSVIGHSARFHCDNYFVLGGISTCLKVSSYPISREFRFLATEFVACSKPQAEIIIVKHPFQGCNNVTRVGGWTQIMQLRLSQKKLWHFWPRFWGALKKVLGLF